MPIIFIYSCECAFFSLLIGAYFNSVSFGFGIMGIAGISLYTLFQRYFSPLILVWGVTLLAALATFLWGSVLDSWLGTSFFAVLFSICISIMCFISNNLLFKKYYS